MSNIYTELAIIVLFNTLCFWKRPFFMLVPVAMLDVIYGLLYATSTNVVPVYNSTVFWEGLVIAILGLYIFIHDFVWVGVLKR